MATNEKLFFTQFYAEGAFDYQEIAADDNHFGLWLGNYEPTEEWLQCTRCKVWFHRYCFFDDNRRWN